MKLALHIIAKNEAQELSDIISDYNEYFDEICIALDDMSIVDDIDKTDKVKIFPYKWRDDFAHKRNFLVENTESEYYFRIDTDDIIDNPEAIREVFDDVINNDYDAVFFPYIYSRDDDGNCIAKHWRETIIKKTAGMYWKKAVHENIFVEDLSKYKALHSEKIRLIHDIGEDHAKISSERNFKILIKEFNRDKENTDPRTIAYIGRMLMGYEDWKRAIYFLNVLIQKTGWDDDKYFAWVHLGHCHYQLGENDTAIAAFNEALAINTEYPDAYLALCEIYITKKDYKKAVHWGLIGVSKPEPHTTFVLDPSKYTYRAAMNLAFAYLGVGDMQKAKACYDKAYAYAPSNETIIENKELFEEAYENDEYFKKLMWMVMFTKEKDNEKVEQLVESIPRKLLKDERMMGLRHRFLKPKTWDNKSIVFFCGQAWEDWAAPSVIKGIGGSEEAVIYLSKEFVKLGYNVTVFNSCGDLEGEYDGVKYEPFYNFNPNDEFNILIAWRGDIFGNEINAKKKLIWLHDVPQPGQFKEKPKCDKVIVLSEYHKTLLPSSVPEEQIYVSTNGINLQDFQVTGIPRNPRRIIYTSSYDRGIQHLLLGWRDIQKKVPDAELHLFYGWDCYDRMMEQGFRSPKFKEAMTKLMKAPNVFDHGRIGHKQLVKEFMKSGVYAYPCHFEEISCISAMKAQACGCVPVVVNYAALQETIKEGVRIDGKAGDEDVNRKFCEALVETLLNPQEDLRGKVLKHKDEFGWDKVAKKWAKEILS